MILRVRGESDSVSAGDTLAFRIPSPEVQALLDDLRAGLARLNDETDGERQAHRERLADLAERCRSDSLELALAVTLQSAGFSTFVSIDAKRAALSQRARQRTYLRAAFRRTLDRIQRKREELEKRLTQVQAADSLARAVLVSGVDGSIRSVRTHDRGTGSRVVFSIGVAGECPRPRAEGP